MALRLSGHRTYPYFPVTADGKRNQFQYFGGCSPLGRGGLGHSFAPRIDLGRIVFVYCRRAGRHRSRRRDVCTARHWISHVVVVSVGAKTGVAFGLVEDYCARRFLDGVSAEHVSVRVAICVFGADRNVEWSESTFHRYGCGVDRVETAVASRDDWHCHRHGGGGGDR